MSDRMKIGEKTITGYLANDPREVTSREGKALTALRVLENQRVFDREHQKWVDGEAVGYDVAIVQDRLRENALAGLSKGDRVTVRGNYEVSPYVNQRTGEAGLNHRIGAREVSVSMFDDRFDPSVVAERDASVVADMEHTADRAAEQEWPPGFSAERAPLDGPGTPAPPGPPPVRPNLSERELQEIAQRQQRMAAQQGAMYQQQYNTLPPRPGAQGPGL